MQIADLDQRRGHGRDRSARTTATHGAPGPVAGAVALDTHQIAPGIGRVAHAHGPGVAVGAAPGRRQVAPGVDERVVDAVRADRRERPVDGVALGDGSPGPIARRLREIYLEESRKTAI